jgi:hypothetical protein
MNNILKQIDKMSMEDISMLTIYVNQRIETLRTNAVLNFTKGDKVEFTDSRTGKVQPGVVFKVKKKYIEIDILDGAMRYNVPSTMLRSI